jgi:hypothetical protein
VKAIAASRHTGGNAEPVKIVIDDRLKPEDGEQEAGDDQPPADDD